MRAGTNECDLLCLLRLGEGFGGGRAVVARRVPGVRLTVNGRNGFEDPLVVFFGVAVIIRAEQFVLGSSGEIKWVVWVAHRSLQL